MNKHCDSQLLSLAPTSLCLGRRKEHAGTAAHCLPSACVLVHGSNPTQHVSKAFHICQIGDSDYGVTIELSHSVSQPFTNWFIGLSHLEQSYAGIKLLFEFEELSTTLLYLDQVERYKAVHDDKFIFTHKAKQICIEISCEILTYCCSSSVYLCTMLNACVYTYAQITSLVHRLGLHKTPSV